MNNNLFLAIILSLGIVLGFQYLYVKPHQQALASHSAALQTPKIASVTPPVGQAQALRDRDIVLKENPRVDIETPELMGSINLKGARIDDLMLVRYRETEDPHSPAIILLSPDDSAPPHRAYYAEFSWLAEEQNISLPTSDTLWSADGTKLTPDHPIKLTWNNGQGLIFERTIAVDQHALFTFTDRVTNTNGAAITLYPFGLVARQGMPNTTGSSVIHEGALGVLGGTLEEYKYNKLIEDGKKTEQSIGGWLGFTDKYWLVAMIPPQDERLTADFSYHSNGAVELGQGFFQSDYRGVATVVPAKGSTEIVSHLFAGAKRVRLLDGYADQYNISHFDRAIDFGWFYFLTKPFLYLLAMLSTTVGSIGLAILLFTVLLKIATLPLSLKSYHSMARMKALQPEMKRIQERFPDDKLRQQQEIMELYKREKVSPLSGCLPTLIQIPIFFALYKVLYVSIEMRQAPFYGWIKDMSVPDPTSWSNFFGLAPWHVPDQIAFNLQFFTLYLPPALHIGAWPVLMGLSMFLQQKLSPQPPDKSQARIFLIMPIVFTYMLSSMPAGLVIYWTWSNLIGIAQQWFIMSRDAMRKGNS